MARLACYQSIKRTLNCTRLIDALGRDWTRRRRRTTTVAAARRLSRPPAELARRRAGRATDGYCCLWQLRGGFAGSGQCGQL